MRSLRWWNAPFYSLAAHGQEGLLGPDSFHDPSNFAASRLPLGRTRARAALGTTRRPALPPTPGNAPDRGLGLLQRRRDTAPAPRLARPARGRAAHPQPPPPPRGPGRRSG